MISEGSCDTEDWSNDAENSALPSEEKFYFKICYLGYTLYIKQKLFQNYCFNLNKWSLCEHKKLLWKT